MAGEESTVERGGRMLTTSRARKNRSTMLTYFKINSELALDWVEEDDLIFIIVITNTNLVLVLILSAIQNIRRM